MAQQIIFHMAHEADWQAAQSSGLYQGSPDDLRDGFIHFSTAQQVAGSAAKHRAGQADLLLIAVDVTSLGPDLRWEGKSTDNLFPHLYRPLRVNEAQSVVPLPLGPNGLHQFPNFEGL